MESFNSTTNVAKVIKSSRGKMKIMIDGFLFVKEKNHDDIFYWVYERRHKKDTKCNARAVTMYSNGKHAIKKFDSSAHNHAADASQPYVLQVQNKIKETA